MDRQTEGFYRAVLQQHSILYAHSTLYTRHYTLYTIHYTLYTTHYILHTIHYSDGQDQHEHEHLTCKAHAFSVREAAYIIPVYLVEKTKEDM